MRDEAHDMSRKAIREFYDAHVDLEPVAKGELSSYAFALVKLTYRIEDNGPCRLTTPEPLLFDFLHDDGLEPKLPTGSDFWPHKLATDVVVLGSALAPAGKPCRSMEVHVSIGGLVKRVSVFGRREIRWSATNRIEIAAPEPFTEMPLVHANAYGGLDPRVPIPEAERDAYMALAEQGLAFDHPGSYPRNLVGKGYLVVPGPILGLEMPNLEDPQDLLTANRLVVGSPENWYRQPLPWNFAWTNPLMYPRQLFLGADAWHPCRELQLLPEVRRGLVSIAALQAARRQDELHPEYFQEASLGMVIRSPLAGQRVTVTGMNAEMPTMGFTVPPDPSIEFTVDGRRTLAKPMISSLVVKPGDRTFAIVYCAKLTPLPRKFIPEVHASIPLSISVNRDVPVAFDTPPTIRERLARAQATLAGK